MIAAESLRLDRWLLEAAALEPAERRSYLACLAAAEPEAAAEIRRRLEAAGEPGGSFLPPPGTRARIAAAAASPRDPTPPADDDRYRIGECLGEGGMARVYRAFDRQLDRSVALKVLCPREGRTRAETRQAEEVQERVLREARAQARIRHDHVLDVYETGRLDGRPYIAVRYVAGGTLADLADAVASGLSPSLDQRVRLVAQAAYGLHAAHRQGLLHGDVKPSNVLVEETQDGDLRAWIGDFGIATELARSEEGGEEETGEEETGEVLGGTPIYMAPELLGRGSRLADRRSDVYSLGVTLHQVLTGELPDRSAVRLADLRGRYAELPVDLLAIVARCLAAIPRARYASARAVAEDLERYLDGDVVEAYADRLVYRWSRFAVRNRRLLTVAGVGAVLLTAALVVAAVLGVQAMRANELVEDRREQAEGLIDFMLTDLRGKLEGVGRLELLDDVGERAMAYFAAVPEEELSDEELARRSQALHQIGQVRISRGDLAGAEAPLRESLTLARELSGRRPENSDRLFDLGQSEFWAGYALWKRGELEGAQRHFEAYHRISSELVRRDGDNVDWQRELAYAESNLGSVLQQAGDLEGALRRFEASLALDRQRVAAAVNPEARYQELYEMAGSHNTVGVLLEQLGRLDAAESHYRAELGTRQDLARRDPDHMLWHEYLGTSHHYLGRLYLARGELGRARSHATEEDRIFASLVLRDESNERWLRKRAQSLLGLAQIERTEGDAERASGLAGRSLDISRAMNEREPVPLAWRIQLVATYCEWVRTERILRPVERDGLWTRLDGEVASLTALSFDQEDRLLAYVTAEALLLLGDLEAREKRLESARLRWRRAVEVLRAVGAAGSRDHYILRPLHAAVLRLEQKDEAASLGRLLQQIGVQR